MSVSRRATWFSVVHRLRKKCAHTSLVLLGSVLLQLPSQALAAPTIAPSLQKMLGALPINEGKEELQKMMGALQQTSCGGGLTGCYATSSGPMQLYFFSSGQTQQTLLLVLDKKMSMPHLLSDKVQKLMGTTTLSSPIIAISTTDFDLDTAKMPAALQKVVRDSYFNVSSLSFASGVQLAARANLGGPLKLSMEAFGVSADQLTIRAAVVMPIPADLMGGASTGIGVADKVAQGETMKKAGVDALKPEAFIEFQFAPGSKLPIKLPQMNLSDATFFINNSLTFGYKGNAAFKGADNRKIIIQFQTPLTPEGALDLLDFQFRMSTPANFTMEDAAHVMFAMATPDTRLAKYGGGFIRNIDSYKNALLTVTKPLSVFQLKNPNPTEYRFGDSTKPFPEDAKFFNIALLGPTADGGPFMRAAGDVRILGQKMGWLDASAGLSGLDGNVGEAITLKLGPLGKVRFKMQATVDVDQHKQNINLLGNFAGQKVSVTLSGASMAVEVNASCINPFEIKTKVSIQDSTDIADVFEGQGGVNVDPSGIYGCMGKDLEAAYNKIAGEYKHLEGYTAAMANAELKKISDTANMVAKQAEEEAQRAAKEAQKVAEKAAEDARKDYEKAKNAARDVATKATNAASKAFNDAGNAFKRIGKKKKHKKGPDPKFAASVFDWDYYYDHQPDVVNAKVDLASHWKDWGFNEGRQASSTFSVRFYLSRYTDVQAQCGATGYQCALQHWLDKGIDQGRQGSADFSVFSYLKRYGDLQAAFGATNYADALDHWINDGEDEGRNGRADANATGPLGGPVIIGGDGGSAWDDLGACNGQFVTGFRIRAGKTVDGVQFKYGNTWAGAHGASGGYSGDVSLAPGEYIVQVDYRNGKSVDRISFTSNLGRTYGPYGGTGGSAGVYRVNAGEKLGCMVGRSGKSMDSLTFSSTGPR